ncbi:tetratricopeptide repeat protein [Candidatus Protochlamydia phocaeensis]|uniref:tetratricopeptide repeat protein n=1 Tax=Candidatus Protochlamydia phocaeensis TaxID=1414722 RepID=UPI000837E72B|nr:tetratricopeptide repeat protein [Candidatus Protochlamydia phocaeensis]
MKTNFSPFYPEINSFAVFEDDLNSADIGLQPAVPWQGLCLDVISHLACFFDFQDLLHFEQVEKRHLLATHVAWKELRKKDHFQFDWSECQSLPNKEKWNYLFGAMLVQILSMRILFRDHVCLPLMRDTLMAIRMREQFSYIIKNSTLLGTYLSQNLKELSHSSSIQKDILGKLDLNVTSHQEAKIPVNRLFGGDVCLEGLQAFIKWTACLKQPNSPPLVSFDIVKQTLTEASEKGATFPSTILARFQLPLSTPIFASVYLELQQGLAIQAERQGDCRALIELASHSSLPNLEKLHQHSQHPWLLFQLACHYRATDIKKADTFFSQSILGYGKNSPPQLLYKAGLNKCHLNKKEEAAALFEQAIKAYGQNIPLDLRCWAAHVNHLLKNYQKAITLLEGVPFPTLKPRFICLIGFCYFHLGKYGKAEEAFELSLSIYGPNAPIEALWAISRNLYKLKRYKKVILLLKKAIGIYKSQNQPVSPKIYSKLAGCLFELRQYRKACPYFEKAVQGYKFQAPFTTNIRLLERQAANLLKLKRYQKALLVFEKILAVRGTQVSYSVLLDTLTTLLNLKKEAEAELLFNQILVRHGTETADALWQMAQERKESQKGWLCFK